MTTSMCDTISCASRATWGVLGFGPGFGRAGRGGFVVQKQHTVAQCMAMDNMCPHNLLEGATDGRCGLTDSTLEPADGNCRPIDGGCMPSGRTNRCSGRGL